MKLLIIDTKKKIYRATSVMFIVQLFGALGAGLLYFIGQIFFNGHFPGADTAGDINILWFIFFYATDFAVIFFALTLSYLIAGLPAVAPSLTLALYFANFAGDALTGGKFYFNFFATPANQGGGVNIGYMSYLIMALMVSLMIKCLYIAWDKVKDALGKKLDSPIEKLRKKIKLIPAALDGIGVLEMADILLLYLIIPVVSTAVTWGVIRYGIQKPFALLGDSLIAPLTAIASKGTVLIAVIFGLMIGFDITGPLSMAAFAVAVATFAGGDSRLITIYAACFVTVGWIPFGAVLLGKITKKLHSDADDFNIAVSGPINAFFENIKLTVAFSMNYAYRSPFTVIPGYMVGCAFAGLLIAIFGIVNTDYLTGVPKNGNGRTYAELFAAGEHYVSFTLPLRSGDWLTCRIPLFFIIIICGFIGGGLIILLKRIETKIKKKHGTYFEANDDIILETRNFAKKLNNKNVNFEMKQKFDIKKCEPINVGLSSDKKYFLEAADGERFLLRISDVSEYERKKTMFDIMKKAADIGIPMCKPVDFGICNDGKTVYQLLTWCEGEDLDKVLPTLPKAEQYALGIKAGEILKMIHSIPIPHDFDDWSVRYFDQNDGRITAFKNCGIQIDGSDQIIKFIENNKHLLRNRPQCFNHGDFHVGNLMITSTGELSVIDWETLDFDNCCDPWNEFNRIGLSDICPYFTTGLIRGYFNGEPPIEFWHLLAFYLAAGSLMLVSWAYYSQKDELDYAIQQVKNILNWYDNMQCVIPNWYINNYEG